MMKEGDGCFSSPGTRWEPEARGGTPVPPRSSTVLGGRKTSAEQQLARASAPTVSREFWRQAGARGVRTGLDDAQFHNASVNTIALSCGTAYHGYMTTGQTPKRAGYMNPISQLGAALKPRAALIGGVVAV